jgi:hypothetical protein
MRYVQALAMLALLSLPATAANAEPVQVRCPSEPPIVRRLHLQERWRIDSEDPEAPLLGFFHPSQVVVHAGRVYLLDYQLCQIYVYSDDGEYLTTFLREGEGPGEVRNPGALLLRGDGTLAIQHGSPSKLEFVTLDGTPLGRWRLQASAMMYSIRETSRGWFGSYTEVQQGSDPSEYLAVFHAAIHDSSGARVAEFHREEKRFEPQRTKSDEAKEYPPWYTAAAVSDSEVVLAPVRDEYRIEWRNLRGETTRAVTRTSAAHRRTREELETLKYSAYSISQGEIIFADRKLCDHDPMIEKLEPLPDGSLRVRTSLFEKDMPPGMVCRFEVHEATGELRERVEIYDPSGDYDVDYDMIALLDDGRAMVLRNQRPTSDAWRNALISPKLREKLPPPPDEREDIAFTPIMCDLVPQ